MPDSIPAPEAQRVIYLSTLADTLAANYAAYFLTDPQTDELLTAVTEFGMALRVASNDATRTKVTINAKNAKMAVATSLARELIQTVKIDVRVAPELKTAAGIPLPRVGPAAPPLPVPPTRPTLGVNGVLPGSQTLSFRDSVETDRRGRPRGVASLLLLRAVGDGPEPDVGKAEILGNYTRGPIGVPYDHADNGKTATYWACWCNPREERGLLSLPVSMTIAA